VLPVQFNGVRDILENPLEHAANEIVKQFGAVSFD
jgi:hypothetical protein